MRLSEELRTIRQQAADNPPKPMDKSWKKMERRVAKALGGQRVPLSGGLSPASGLDKTDVMKTIFPYVECKLRKRWDVPGYIKKLEAQSVRVMGMYKWLLVVKKPRTKRTYAIMLLSQLGTLVKEAGLGDTDRAFIHRVLYVGDTWHIEDWIEKAEDAAGRQPWMIVLRRHALPEAYVVVPFDSVKVFVQEIRSRPLTDDRRTA